MKAPSLQVGPGEFDSHGSYQMKKEEAVAAKKAEIEHYEGVLQRYGSGRWLDQGRRP